MIHTGSVKKNCARVEHSPESKFGSGRESIQEVCKAENGGKGTLGQLEYVVIFIARLVSLRVDVDAGEVEDTPLKGDHGG